MDNVEAAKVVDCGPDHCLHIAKFADVSPDEVRLSRCRPDGVDDLLSACRVDVCSNDFGPLLGEETAVARPMPEAAPVIKATLSANNMTLPYVP